MEPFGSLQSGDPAAYGRVAWVARKVRLNARWMREQGPGRLVEEHELDPLRRLRLATQRAVWRRRHRVAPGSSLPAFLSGVPRSGTNMMVRSLATLPQVEVHNEGDTAAFRRYRLRDDTVVRDVILRSAHQVVLFKPLLDSHRLLTLLDGLPGVTPGRAIWAFRDFEAQARSDVEKFGSASLGALTDIRDGRGEHRWQAQGMSPATRHLLHSLEWDALTAWDGAALVAVVRHQLFFDLGLDRREDTIAVSYDAIVRNPEPSMRALCGHLGLPWRAGIAQGIDRRSLRPHRPVPLHPTVRALSTEMSARLERAALTSPRPGAEAETA